MKKYTHAWLALKAVELLKGKVGKFNVERNKRLERFLEFITSDPTSFVRGAWFQDTMIKDNVEGGHTWKYSLDPVNGRSVNYRPPAHNTCIQFVSGALDAKVSLNTKTSDLPDRCEALSQSIRDTILITNKIESGDVIGFNNSQTALFFLMLAHYICDAHMPLHCDNRDFYDPSKIHEDLEGFWEGEVTKYYKVSKKRELFDLDEDQNLQRINRDDYELSILSRCDEILATTTWENMAGAGGDWRVFLGQTNNNFWDYLVSVCLVSFHLSVAMFPVTPPPGIVYQQVRIMTVSPFKERVLEYSPYILADAINSIALLWLAAWERWELLKKGVR